MTRRIRTLAVVFTLGVTLFGATGGHAQTARTRRLMQDKLAHAQHILAALTTSDYALLQKETLALKKVTESPQWAELMTPSCGRIRRTF